MLLEQAQNRLQAHPARSLLDRLGLLLKRPAHLPIDGLPGSIGEVQTGEAALLLHADADFRERLLRGLIPACLADQRVTWICSAQGLPESLPGEVQAALEEGNLRLLTWSADAPSHLRQFGSQILARELADGGTHVRDIVVVDVLDPWLAEAGSALALEGGVFEALQYLKRWSRSHKGPVIALAPEQFRGQSLLPFALRSRIQRLAVLERRDGGVELDVYRWGPDQRDGRGAMRATLVADSGDRWRYLCAGAFDSRAALTPPDHGIVHVMRAAIDDFAQLPDGWRAHPDLDSLLEQSRDAVGATMLLSFEHADALPELAQAVHKLRHEHPHLLKIVVREHGASMRKNGELALLRLGANAVFGRAVQSEQLVKELLALRDAVHGERRSSTPQQAIQALAPEPVQGYLAPLAFCTSVERMIDRTAHAPLNHTLVHLPLLPHVAHVDALIACAPRRDGDVISNNASGLYLFLFGCAPDDAMAALDSIFVTPCSEIAQHVQIDPDPASQLRTLARLRQEAEEGNTDFSAVLRGITASGRRPPATTPAILPVRSPDNARSVQSHVLPLRTAAA
jgi:cellulose biosynthesis protein BcsE